MFVFENWVNDRRARIAAWEKAREDYREKADYSSQVEMWERSHPYPVVRWNKVLGTVLPFALAGIVGTLLVLTVITPNKKKPEPKKDAPAISHNCKDFNKDDYVRIQFGDLVGATGVLVGGCAEGQSYQVRLDKQDLEIPNDGKDGLVNVENWVVSVGTDNLVGIDKPKEQ